jgi:hypothetical protein
VLLLKETEREQLREGCAPDLHREARLEARVAGFPPRAVVVENVAQLLLLHGASQGLKMCRDAGDGRGVRAIQRTARCLSGASTQPLTPTSRQACVQRGSAMCSTPHAACPAPRAAHFDSELEAAKWDRAMKHAARCLSGAS